jgi:hypothetical protein
VNFSAESFQASKTWDDIFKVLKKTKTSDIINSKTALKK